MLGRTPNTASRLIGTGRLPQGASRRLVPLHTPQVRPLRRTPARPDGACLQRPAAMDGGRSSLGLRPPLRSGGRSPSDFVGRLRCPAMAKPSVRPVDALRRVGDRAPRPPGDLPDRGGRPAGGPDPRDGQLLEALGEGRAAAGRPLHGRRPRPARPRRLRRGPRRLLPRRPRLQHPRPADDHRDRPRHGRRPLARRRDRDAVLLPVPPAGRAPCADLERRPRPRGEPDAARRRPAGRRGGDLAGRQPAGPRGDRADRRADAGARQPQGRLPAGGRRAR